MQECQYRLTSYDEGHGGPDFTPAYGIQLHDPRLSEYGCAGVGSVAQPQPRIMATPLREREDAFGRVTAAARRWSYTIECTGSAAARHGA